MKFQHLLILPVLLILLSSCKKDDPIVEQEDTASYIKATFDWDQEFLTLAEITTASDSLPTGIDLVNEDSRTLTLSSLDTEIDFVAFAQDPDGEFDGETILYAFQGLGEDTILLAFEIHGDLEAKSYAAVTQAQMQAYYEDDIDYPNGTIVTYFISDKSEVSNGVSFASVFGAIDYGTSTFEITELDETKNEISGTFTFDWHLVDSDGNTTSLLKSSDGVFNNLQLIK